MAYTRAGRPTLYFQARTSLGWRLTSTRTSDKALARKIEDMWETLATKHRAWDLLEMVVARRVPIGRLFDAWRDAGRDVEECRRRLNDIDLEPLVADFLAVHKAKVKPDSLAHVEHHVRTLMPVGAPFVRSRATQETLTRELYAYPGKPGTIRKVHSDWSVFFAYLTDVRGLYDRNPMDRVARPPAGAPVIQFYELDVVERIIEWQPTVQRRALMALLYGSSVDVSAALPLTRGDFDPTTREFRGIGTKAHTRDRILRIADWAWPMIWEYIKTMTPHAKLFDGVTRSGASFWHRQAVKTGIWEPSGAPGVNGGVAKLVKAALDLASAYPLRCSRHHWAVRALRAGTPIGIVQRQLGHASPNLTLRTYGQFVPSGADRDRWETAATAYEKTRREASETGESSDLSSACSSETNPSPLTNSRGGT